MSKEKRSHNRHNNNSGNRSNWKNSSRREDSSSSGSSKKSFFKPPKAVTSEQIKADEEAIREFKSANRPNCAHCGEPILDMSSALPDRKSGAPIHFDCALEELSELEKTGQNERLGYIGQGRFGIIYYPNPHDIKHFVIKKIIDWEEKDKKAVWRDEMAELYSHVK